MNKLLISAYAVSPIRGSECAVGWEITTRLAQYFDVTVLVCEETPSGKKYFDEIQEYMQNNKELANLKFVPISMPSESEKYTKLHDLGFWPAFYWSYKCWQKKAYKVAKDLHALNKFDLVYQLNMIGFREPGYLWKLDIPFVWGPTNGFHSIPFSFIKTFKGKEKFFQVLKHVFNELQILVAFRPKKAAKKAKVVWCVDQIAFTNIKKWGGNAILMQETGLSVLPKLLTKEKTYDGKRNLNLVWSGMITSGKALSILIEALILVKDINFHVTILGDGNLQNEMVQLAKPIQSKITWLGWVDRDIVFNELSKSDLLIFTSLKEATSVTVMESLGVGVPVICHDTCGMGTVINENNGFKIPYVDAKTSIEYIANKIIDITENPEILNSKFNTIWRTTDALTWNDKVKKIADSFNNILKNN